MKIAGLDIGTTGCKCTVFDADGNDLGRAYREYAVQRNESGHEIDAKILLNAVFETIAEMAGKYPDIKGIGVTSFGETFVMTDEDGTPLHPAMLYTDPRGEEQSERLVDKLGSRQIQKITGLKPHATYSMPKMMWVKENLREVEGDASHIFLMEDFVVFHLTGVAQIDYSLASRTQAFDIVHLCWSKVVFDQAGIDIGKMSKPVPTGTPAGPVRPEVAKRLGLGVDTVVVSAAHDQVAAAIGAGVFDGSTAADGAGTVECMVPVYDTLPDMDVMYEGNYAVIPYVIPGKYVTYAFSYTGGALIQWCADVLAKEEKLQAAARHLSVNELLEQEYIKKRGDVPGKLLVLPHFAGAATPYMDAGSRGAILGLSTDSRVYDIYRACMEGVVYEMLLNFHLLVKSGIGCKKMAATGGGAKSKIWMQMKADILDIPITALSTSDAGTVGASMLTGLAIGAFRDLADAAAQMVQETVTYQPNKERHRMYIKNYERYVNLYRAVRPLVGGER